MKSVCPICQKPFKVLKQCICGRWVCKACMIQNQCLDCYTILNDKTEVMSYFDEKYAVDDRTLALM